MFYLSKMKIKIEDIVLGIIVSLIVTTAIWLLIGSIPEKDALASIALFIAASEILLWKKLFSIDKNTSVIFSNLKSYIKEIKKKAGEL